MNSTVTEDRSAAFGAQSMIGALEWVLLHRPGAEYTSEAWHAYGLAGEPDLAKAQQQHDAFASILKDEGVEVAYLTEDTSIQCSATYDPTLVTREGAVILQSGRPERQVEMEPMARRLTELGIPIIGSVEGDGFMDGGDTTWLDEETLLVACGYRTNLEGVAQLKRLLDGVVETVEVFDNPHFRGPGHVIHLMSYLSIVDRDVALVHLPLMPVRLVQLLEERNFRFVEVPDEEFLTEGCNVLTLRPGVVVGVAGNPVTASRLRDAGVTLIDFEGDEICKKRLSGPTCNSRPLRRAPLQAA